MIGACIGDCDTEKIEQPASRSDRARAGRGQTPRLRRGRQSAAHCHVSCAGCRLKVEPVGAPSERHVGREQPAGKGEGVAVHWSAAPEGHFIRNAGISARIVSTPTLTERRRRGSRYETLVPLTTAWRISGSRNGSAGSSLSPKVQLLRPSLFIQAGHCPGPSRYGERVSPTSKGRVAIRASSSRAVNNGFSGCQLGPAMVSPSAKKFYLNLARNRVGSRL